MDRRSNNIAIFQDSMDLIKANQKLQQAVQFSIQNQKLYVPSQAIALPKPGKSPCKTIVSSKRSFEAAPIPSGNLFPDLFSHLYTSLLS